MAIVKNYANNFTVFIKNFFKKYKLIQSIPRWVIYIYIFYISYSLVSMTFLIVKT